MSIEDKLDIIGDSLSDIKGAIIAKGVTPEGNITTYANAIGEIGGRATLFNLTVTPSTTSQTITPASGTDGYGTISVSAVTAAIDSDIVAGNIKSGVEILGVTGNYSGTTPTGTYTITANGTYDVTNYASANVSVAGGGSDTIAVTLYNDGTYGWSSGSSYLTINGETRTMIKIASSKYYISTWSLEKNTTYTWTCTNGIDKSGTFTTGTNDMVQAII